MTIRITGFVKGQPQQKGSKRGFKCGDFINIVDTNSKKFKAYEALIAAKFHDQSRPVTKGPVSISIEFKMTRGKTVKRDLPTVKPDIDKLVRCVLDALTGVIYKDDSQVVELIARKNYSTRPGTAIDIAIIEENSK